LHLKDYGLGGLFLGLLIGELLWPPSCLGIASTVAGDASNFRFPAVVRFVAQRSRALLWL
jgi:hypothetical protein